MATEKRATIPYVPPVGIGKTRVLLTAETEPRPGYPERWGYFLGTMDGEPVRVTVMAAPEIIAIRRSLKQRPEVWFDVSWPEIELLPAAVKSDVDDGDIRPAALAASVDEALATLNEQARDALR